MACYRYHSTTATSIIVLLGLAARSVFVVHSQECHFLCPLRCGDVDFRTRERGVKNNGRNGGKKKTNLKLSTIRYYDIVGIVPTTLQETRTLPVASVFTCYYNTASFLTVDQRKIIGDSTPPHDHDDRLRHLCPQMGCQNHQNSIRKCILP